MLKTIIKDQINIASDFSSPLNKYDFIKKAALSLLFQVIAGLIGLFIAFLLVKALNSGLFFHLFINKPGIMALLSNNSKIIGVLSYALVISITIFVSTLPMVALGIRRAKHLGFNALWAGISSSIFGNIALLALIFGKAINFMFYTDHALQSAYRSQEPYQLKLLMVILILLAIYFICLVLSTDKERK